MFKWIECMLLGHKWRPAYTFYRGLAQYTCDCCGCKTPWMPPREHREWCAKVKPTWGGRGSNSQGYPDER
jgi:hypothetical protein